MNKKHQKEEKMENKFGKKLPKSTKTPTKKAMPKKSGRGG
jgi:hypothetical protein